LHGHRLVKLRRKGEAHLQHVTLRQSVERTAFPSELKVSLAVRPPGLRSLWPMPCDAGAWRNTRARTPLGLPWFLGLGPPIRQLHR
jgi:hypothetical protein